MNHHHLRALVGTASTFALLLALPAGAQVSEPSSQANVGLEDITVTARRVAENVQRVPIAVAVIDDETLRRQDIRVAGDLNKSVSGLQICCGRGNSNFPFLRGIGGIVGYFAEVPNPLIGYGIYYDVGSVQVLKGPQGTLFGIASNGGAMVIEPKKPGDRFGGYVRGTVGDYGRRTVEGAVDLPVINDKFLLRVGVLNSHTDGYVRNLATGTELGEENYSVGRLSAIVRFTDRIENYTLVNYYDFHGTPQQPVPYAINPTGAAAAVFGLANLNAMLATQQALGRYQVTSLNVQDPRTWTKQLNIVDIFSWDITDALTLKNIAGYTSTRSFTRSDGEGSPFAINNTALSPESLFPGRSPVWSDELQLQGTQLDGKLSFTLGAFYTTNTTHPVAAYSTTLGSTSGMINKTSGQTRAIYGQANYDLSALLEGLSLTGGYRYTWDSRRANQVRLNSAGVVASEFSARGKFSSPSYTISLAYQMTPATMLYLTNSKGYSAGGFNITSPVAIRQFQPESLDNFEVGIKTDWSIGDMIVRSNLSAYYGLFDDVQVPATVLVQTPAGPALSAATTNAAKAHIAGAEGELTFIPFDNLEIAGNFSYMRNRFDRYNSLSSTGQPLDLSGSVFLYSPKWKGTLRGSYRLPLNEKIGDVTFSAIYSYTGEAIGRVQVEPVNPADVFAPVKNLDLTLDWADVAGHDGVSAELYMTNVTNNIWTQGGFGAYAALGINSRYGEQPRMIGARLSYNF